MWANHPKTVVEGKLETSYISRFRQTVSCLEYKRDLIRDSGTARRKKICGLCPWWFGNQLRLRCGEYQFWPRILHRSYFFSCILFLYFFLTLFRIFKFRIFSHSSYIFITIDCLSWPFYICFSFVIIFFAFSLSLFLARYFRNMYTYSLSFICLSNSLIIIYYLTRTTHIAVGCNTTVM